jgi:hypothetical protein
VGIGFGIPAAEPADHRHRRLLRLRDHWPRRRTPKPCDKFSPSHWLSSQPLRGRSLVTSGVVVCPISSFWVLRMRRRDFIASIGAAAWPPSASAHQSAAASARFVHGIALQAGQRAITDQPVFSEKISCAS